MRWMIGWSAVLTAELADYEVKQLAGVTEKTYVTFLFSAVCLWQIGSSLYKT